MKTIRCYRVSALKRILPQHLSLVLPIDVGQSTHHQISAAMVTYVTAQGANAWVHVPYHRGPSQEPAPRPTPNPSQASVIASFDEADAGQESDSTDSSSAQEHMPFSVARAAVQRISQLEEISGPFSPATTNTMKTTFQAELLTKRKSARMHGMRSPASGGEWVPVISGLL